MKKLVAYITSSYPDKNFSIDLALSMKESGVDMLELGMPFSDAVADGPIIEKANLLSLERGYTFNDLLDISKAIAPNLDTLWMGYFNSFYAKGFENTIQTARSLGVNGFIIPDLPHEEASFYNKAFDASDIACISFVAPTDTQERIKLLVENAKKFIYLVAYAGVTGSGQEEDLSEVISHIRAYSKTPVYIGFGVNEHTAKEKVQGVDGVIVGSAFVKILLDDSLTATQKIAKICSLSKVIKEQINA